MDKQVPAIERLPRRALARSHGPLYRQLADLLREPIISGTFAVGSELPKEAEIAERFGVSLITVRQALQSLESSGLIKKRSAKPAVVTADSPQMALGWTFKNFNDMATFTQDSELRVKSYKLEPAPLSATQHFDIPRDEKCYCLRSVLAVGKQRKAQITTYFPTDIGSRLAREDFDDVLIFRTLQKRLHIRMAVAHCTVRADLADDYTVSELGVTKGSALLVVEMLYQDADQRNVEFSIARHPADLFSISYDAPNDLL